MNVTGSRSKDGVILADSCVWSRVPRSSALSEDNLTRVYDLTSLLLVTETFTGEFRLFLVEPPPRFVELRVWIEPPNVNAGRTEDDAAMLDDAMASDAGACDEGARAAATAVRLSNEEEPVKIMMPI